MLLHVPNCKTSGRWLDNHWEVVAMVITAHQASFVLCCVLFTPIPSSSSVPMPTELVLMKADNKLGCKNSSASRQWFRCKRCEWSTNSRERRRHDGGRGTGTQLCYWSWEQDGEAMGREGVWARSGPLASGGVRGSALTSSEGRNKQAKQPQTVEGERKRKGRGNVCWEFRVRRWNLLEVYWLQVVSVTLLPPSLRWEGRRKGRREAPSHQPAPSLCFFAQKEACTWVWKWNRARLVKGSAASWSFSFSRFPVQGSHFVTQPWSRSLIQSLPLFSLSPLLSPTAGGVSRLALDFLLCRATSLEHAELKEEGGGGTTMVGGGVQIFLPFGASFSQACHAWRMTEVRRRETSAWKDVKLLPG